MTAMVAPKLITPDHALYSVDGVFNGILVKGNMVGEVMFYGQGAGKLATASAVVSDVMDASKHVNVNINTLWDSEKLDLVPIGEAASKFFVRVKGSRAEMESSVSEAFGKVTPVEELYEDEYAFVTDVITEAAYEAGANALGNVINKIRME